MPSKMMSTQQIGRCGELFVQYSLLLYGIDSSLLTTDAGVDLVAYSQKRIEALTIQVKTNLKPKPGGGKGKLALGWWMPDTCPAEIIACVDLESQRIWLFTCDEIAKLAQQHSSGRYQLYMYVDPTVKTRVNATRKMFDFDFQSHLLENRIHKLI